MRFLEDLALVLGRILSLGFLIIVAMMVYEVVARYGFGAPTYWVHEIAGLLAAFAFVFGGAFCMAEESHMRIGIFIDDARPAIRRVAGVASLLAGVVYLSGMAYAAWGMSEKSLFRFTSDGAWNPERSGSTWNTPAPGMLKFALLLGSLLFLLIVLRRLFALVSGKR